jgi:NAD+ kinase
MKQRKIKKIKKLPKKNKNRKIKKTITNNKMVFGIRGNINKPELPGITYKLIKELEKKKTEYCVDKPLAQLLYEKKKFKISRSRLKSNKDLVSIADFIISIGGDGTFLSTAKLVGDKGVPIIGVNLGKLGFLAETPPTQISKFITDISRDRFKIDERTVLEACTDLLPNKKIYGLNEIVINQSGTVKTIEIQAHYNGQVVISYLSDGLIISTPTGSTGYSLSAGGPILSPNSGVIVLAPICPHTLTARPIILPDSGVIRIKVESKVPVIVTADGNSTIKLISPAYIEIKKAHYKIKLAKRLDSNYFKVLNQKLLWGVDVRKNRKTS